MNGWRIVPLFAAFTVLVVACDVERLDPSIPRKTFYQVTLDVTAEDERFDFVGVFECRYNPNVTGGIDYHAPPRYELTKYRQMAKRLPSGAGLIAVPPPICGMNINTWRKGGEVREQVIAERLSNDRPPPIYWLNSSDDPSRIEIYYGHDYYEHPRARIRLHEVSISIIDDARPVDPRVEVDWIKPLSEWRRYWAKYGVPFDRSPVARVIPRHLWAEVDELSAELSLQSRPVPLGADGVDISVARDDLPFDIRERSATWPVFVERGVVNIRTGREIPKSMAVIVSVDDDWRDWPYAVNGRVVHNEDSWRHRVVYDPISGLIFEVSIVNPAVAAILEPHNT